MVKRLAQQDKNQEFWNEVVIFSSKDESLTKAHVKYLESRLVAISIAADRYKVGNGNTPTESILPRSDRDSMEEYIHNLRIVIGTLGHRVLEPIKVINSSVGNLEEPAQLSNFEFEFSVRNLHAKGQQTDDGFVIFAGSDISATCSQSMPGKTIAILHKWMADGTVQMTEKSYVLTKDVVLSSSSYAAALVAGNSRSGPRSWKDKKGRFLKDVEEMLLAGL